MTIRDEILAYLEAHPGEQSTADISAAVEAPQSSVYATLSPARRGTARPADRRNAAADRTQRPSHPATAGTTASSSKHGAIPTIASCGR